MSSDDADDALSEPSEGTDRTDGSAEDDASAADETSPRERLEEGADRAIEQFDQRIVDLLSWILDTETRARIYVYLRQHPGSTSEEIAEGTGLYPSTVREALAELHEEGTVERDKRESEGAGNNPYEYTAIAPSELVGGIADQVQSELNTVFNLDQYLDRGEPIVGEGDEPVTITVDEAAGSDDETAASRDATAADQDATAAEWEATDDADTPSDESDTDAATDTPDAGAFEDGAAEDVDAGREASDDERL